MENKPRSPRSFVPTPKSPRFVFDKDSTKDFGGMVIDRKVTIDAINNPSTRKRRERPSFGGKPKKDVVAPPKPGPNGGGNRAGMGNKERAMQQGPGGRGADRFTKYRANKKKSAKKLPPIVIDPRF